MSLDVAIVSFHGQDGAAGAFADMKKRSADAEWTLQVGLVEHNHGGHLTLRGVFAGHCVDDDEEDPASEGGAGKGALIAAVLGAALGPARIASGVTVGGAAGSALGKPSELETEPQLLVDRLRIVVPRGCSAMVMIASPENVDAMLSALAPEPMNTIRRALRSDEMSTLESSLGPPPPASAVGPAADAPAAKARRQGAA
jgi:hypothetical protein